MAARNSILQIKLPSADNIRQEEISSDTIDKSALAYQAGLEWVFNEERMASHQGWYYFIRIYAI